MAELSAIERGWTAKDVHPDELVDDDWIAANTVPGRAPTTTGRARGAQAGGFTREQMRRIAARTGYPYTEAWSSWNRGAMRGVRGALIHHTGTSTAAPGDYPTLRIVRDGRSDLQNSLCAFGLGRSGRIYLVSEKLSWHAGAGNINGLTDGNGLLAGIEAESDGAHWTAEQVDAYPRLVAAILVEIGEDDRWTTRHGTYALPAGRKTDASGLDMAAFWRRVAGYRADPQTITKGAPTPTGRPTLRRGSTGPDVELVQRWLGVVGPGDAGYGTFGPATEAAVRRYQEMRGLDVDGVVGPATWREMGFA